MKKYLNKGLIYQWFNSAKAAIIIGIAVWGLIANSILNSRLWQVRNDIARSESDYFTASYLSEYVFLGFIFLAIYFISGGINKRNTTMFLSSGPYTKKQIKYNELIGLLITLILFVVTYIYIATTFYIRNNELLSIVNGYWSIIGIEVIKLILFGIIGILFMLIVEKLFSNSVMALVGMIFIIPGSIIAIISKLAHIFNYWGIGDNQSISRKIDYLLYASKEQNHNYKILMDKISANLINIKDLSIEIIIILVIIAIMLVIFNIAQRKYKLEAGTKIFSSSTNEKIIVTLVSVGIGIFVDILLLERSVSTMMYKTGEYSPLIGIDLVKALGADILCIAIIGVVANKIIKKVLRTIG